MAQGMAEINGPVNVTPYGSYDDFQADWRLERGARLQNPFVSAEMFGFPTSTAYYRPSSDLALSYPESGPHLPMQTGLHFYQPAPPQQWPDAGGQCFDMTYPVTAFDYNDFSTVKSVNQVDLTNTSTAAPIWPADQFPTEPAIDNHTSTDIRPQHAPRQSRSVVRRSVRSNPPKIFGCPTCGRQYCRKSTLKAHMKQHMGDKPFICQICGKTFSQAANLTAHRRVHTGEKPFACSICLRPFSQSSSLVTHRRTHTGERPYPCMHCTKSFTDSSTLTKHMRTHTGQKPYSCHLCLMRFSQSGNLHRHMKTHRALAEGDEP